MTGAAMLGMYDMPGVAPANDALWSAVRSALGYGPDTLTRGADVWDIWQDPGLILGQTCGYPYRAVLRGKVQKIATPDYALPGCPPGYYRSAFVVREDSPITSLETCAGRSFAFNEAMSQSGWAAPMHALRSKSLRPGSLLQTGGHAISLAAVARGAADFCAVDLHTALLLQQTGAHPPGLRTIAYTDPTPGLPYICAVGADAAEIRTALDSAVGAPGTQALGLQGLVDIPDAAYLGVATPPSPTKTSLPLRHLTG